MREDNPFHIYSLTAGTSTPQTLPASPDYISVISKQLQKALNKYLGDSVKTVMLTVAVIILCCVPGH